jgi:hypothetical protein
MRNPCGKGRAPRRQAKNALHYVKGAESPFCPRLELTNRPNCTDKPSHAGLLNGTQHLSDVTAPRGALAAALQAQIARLGCAPILADQTNCAHRTRTKCHGGHRLVSYNHIFVMTCPY